MNHRVKKVIKYVSITLLSVIFVVLTGIGIALYFVFTPEKLTPLVVQVANGQLDAKLNIERVELTFFSTFPQFGLEIEGGTLVSKAVRDTMWSAQDTLLTFDRCLVEVRPLDYLLHNTVSVKEMRLEQAEVYAFRDSSGKANWDIYKETTSPKDTVSSTTSLPQEISIDQVRLVNSHFIFDDRDTRVYAKLDSVNLDLKAHLQQKKVLLGINFNNSNMLFWQQDQLLANHIATTIRTELELDRTARTLTLQNTGVNINGLALDVEGTIRQDSLQKAAHTALKYRLHTPSLETLLTLIPESIMKRQQVTTQGEVTINGEVKGAYGEKQMPLLTMNVLVKDAKAHYEGMPYGIDDIDLEFKGQVDLMRQLPSFAHLKIFRFEGAHTQIMAMANIDHLLHNPKVSLNVKSDIDLTRLAQTFPLQEGVVIRGKIATDLSTDFRLSALKKKDYGRIGVTGQLDLKDMEIADSNRLFRVCSDAHFQFTGKEQLEAALQIQRLKWQSPHLNSNVSELGASLRSSHVKDSTRIAKVDGQFEVKEISAHLGDTVSWYTQHAVLKASLFPSTHKPTQPAVSLSLNTDSLYFKMNAYKIGMDKGGFGIRAEQANDSIWLPSGIIGFEHLSVVTPDLKLPIRLSSTQLTVKDQKVMLKNAHMKLGKSDITASGAIFNLYDALKRHQPIRAKLDITSNYLDGNQLINALNTADETQPEITQTVDTLSSEAPLHLFVLPNNIDFALNTHLKQVTYGKMDFTEVKGAVDLKHQSIHLKNLSMRGLDAALRASVVYQAKNKDQGFTGFDLAFEDVNIGNLVDFIPALDSIVPMLRSFKGIVDFNATAEAKLDGDLNLQIPTLRSAVHIKGDSLVLMDGETFAEIAKMMMFKNKKRNLIDSIYVNMTIDDGQLTVYPFVVQMDRYKAAVGGTQDLDMNFKYHISVLKSPVPFKLGVNISGNLDKMKFRIGKAKYKDKVTPVAIREVDSTRINLGKDIIHDFEKIMQQARK